MNIDLNVPALDEINATISVATGITGADEHDNINITSQFTQPYLKG